MAQPVIITGAPAENGGDALAVTVGATAVVAAGAAETASEAAETAETAQTLATSAAETAWDARAEVSRLDADMNELENRVMDVLGDLVEHLAPAELVVEDDGAPEVETATAEPEDDKKEDKPKRDKPKRAGYGSRFWFGEG